MDRPRLDKEATAPSRITPVEDPACQSAAEDRRRTTRRQRRVLVATLVASDGLMVALTLWLAWYLRIGSGLIPYYASAELLPYLRITPTGVILFLGLFGLSGLYRYNLLLGGPQEYGLVFRACSFGVIGLVFVTFMQRMDSPSRGWLLAAWVLSILLVGGGRFVWRRVFQRLRRTRGWLVAPALIVGANEHGRAIARQLATGHAGLRIAGFVDDFLAVGAPVLDDLVVLGTPRQLGELAARHCVEQIILVPSAMAWETFQEVLRRSTETNGCELQISPGFYEILSASVEVTHSGFVPLLRVGQARITGLDLMLKTVLDYGLGTLLAIVCLPVTVAIALVVWVVDGRPVVVRHEVLGLGGRPFQTHKFRTGLLGAVRRRLDTVLPGEVIMDAQASSRLGKFLYRTGLDKLPQFVDVLQGRMSLVGPRTVSAGSEESYGPWLPNLLTAKPGWTGPWAVGGTETIEEEMRLTLYYIRNWTIWLDLQILFQTGRLVLARIMGRTMEGQEGSRWRGKAEQE